MFKTTKTENVIYLIPSKYAIVDLNYIFCFKFDFNCNTETFYRNHNIIRFKSLIYIFFSIGLFVLNKKDELIFFNLVFFFKKNIFVICIRL